jgi:hypothetical protein
MRILRVALKKLTHKCVTGTHKRSRARGVSTLTDPQFEVGASEFFPLLKSSRLFEDTFVLKKEPFILKGDFDHLSPREYTTVWAKNQPSKG